jgi:hypothetical protein
MYPDQAQYFVYKFGTEDFVLKTFVNGNVDNTWMLRQDDVVILVDESMMDITVQLGGSSHAVRKTGQVLSDKVQLSYSRPPLGSDIATINESKRDVLENAFENTSDDLYDSFVEAFGEDVIRSDNR